MTNIIDTIHFKDIEVPVYFHKDLDADDCQISWQARNPNSFYQGYVYQDNETGEITYPDDATIPEQTKIDREIIPKFVIIGVEKLKDEIKDKIIICLNEQYELRNKL